MRFGELSAVMRALADLLRAAHGLHNPNVTTSISTLPLETSTDSRLVFDVIERIHDRVLCGIDTFDNAFVGISAADAALIALLIDKSEIFGLATALLLFSLIGCCFGWFYWRLASQVYNEVPDPKTFIARIAANKENALVDTIDDFRLAIERNRSIRRRKGIIIFACFVCLSAGTAEAISEKVNYQHNESRKRQTNLCPPTPRGTVSAGRWPNADARSARS